jgi:hypothetical protein
MLYGRINLDLTNYQLFHSARFLLTPNFDQLRKIYYSYCRYKNFKSVIPFFETDYNLSNRDIIGYYDANNLVAYTLIIKHPADSSAESEQFAWNYKNPKLRLGVRSIEHECCVYKRLGYKYLYLGEHAAYKSKFDGYEIVGPVLQETTSS